MKKNRSQEKKEKRGTPYEKVEESVKWLVKEYGESKKGYKSPKKTVILGRTFSKGAEFQYMLAKNLFENSKFKVLVDYPISIPKRKQPIYPDILVISNNKLVALIEVKMDPGWIKEERLVESFKRYREIFTKKEFYYKIGEKKEQKAVDVPKSCHRIFIIVSKQNHGDRLPNIKKNARKNKYELLVLLEKTHPNKHSKEEVLKDLSDQKKEINEVLGRVRKRKNRP